MVAGGRNLGLLPTYGDYGTALPDDLDWWQNLNKHIDRYEKIMPRDPQAEAEVDAMRRKLSDPQWNTEKYAAKIRPAAAQTEPSNAYERNKEYVAPGDHVYNTPLSPMEEHAFRNWVKTNNVPFDLNAPVTDYDMRGFWRALQTGNPRAKSAINPADKKLHYPDFWKTPYHETFSNESQWATKKAPHWQGDVLLDSKGNVIFDGTKR